MTAFAETRVVGSEVQDARTVPVVLDGQGIEHDHRGNRFYPTGAMITYIRHGGGSGWTVAAVLRGPALLRDGVVGSHERRLECVEDPLGPEERRMPGYLRPVVRAYHPENTHGWTGVDP